MFHGMNKFSKGGKNDGLGVEPPEKVLLATSFRLLEKMGNTFSALSSIPNLLEIELQSENALST